MCLRCSRVGEGIGSHTATIFRPSMFNALLEVVKEVGLRTYIMITT